MIDVEAILQKLSELEVDHDSYGGLPPKPEALAKTREFFENLTVVPSNYGDVVVESHGMEFDLSLTISAKGVREIYFLRQD